MLHCARRVVHDAGAHIMETPDWLRDPGVGERIATLTLSSGNELRQTGDPAEQLADLERSFDRLGSATPSPEHRENEEAEIMSRKNFAATGSFIAKDRSGALDLLGFSSQLLFNTFCDRRLRDWEHCDDIDLAYGAAGAHNLDMVEFCADERLLPTCYVPLADIGRAGPGELSAFPSCASASSSRGRSGCRRGRAR